MLTNNLKQLINEVKEEKKRMMEMSENGLRVRNEIYSSSKRKRLGKAAVNLFANVAGGTFKKMDSSS